MDEMRYVKMVERELEIPATAVHMAEMSNSIDSYQIDVYLIELSR